MESIERIKKFMSELTGEWRTPVFGNTEIRISLGELEFNALIRGGQVKVKRKDGTPVLIILQDIGFQNMIDKIETAYVSGVKSFKEESIEVDE